MIQENPHNPTSDIYSTISVFQQPHLNSAISKSILFLGSSCVVMIHPPELYKGIWRVDSLTPTFCQWNHARSLYLILDGTRKTPRHFLDPKQKQTSSKSILCWSLSHPLGLTVWKGQNQGTKDAKFCCDPSRGQMSRTSSGGTNISWTVVTTGYCKRLLGRILSGKLELH